jgi:hypothetical protein
MNKEFIPYEQALQLKELGFNEGCLGYHNIDPYLPKPTFNLVKPFDHEWCLPAPLYQQAFRWFREKGCLFEVSVDNKARVWGTYKTYDEAGLEDGDERVILYSKYFDTYEEAELACLKKLIEIIKNK